MISNSNKNVIFVKNIPSNVIDEAIFILKEDVSDSRLDVRLDIAKDEAELFLQGCVESEISKKLKDKKERDRKRRGAKEILWGILVCIGVCIFWRWLRIM